MQLARLLICLFSAACAHDADIDASTNALGMYLLSTMPVSTRSRLAVLHGGARRSPKMVEIGDTGVAFENVARQWRCKYSAGESGGPGDSASLKACQALLNEFLPKLKALPKAEITRQVCGGCLDFKVTITQPLKEHDDWKDEGYPLEEEFMKKLAAIEGTSMHETQEMTNQKL
mmetsp:Transcript_28498/g.44573  ORF Transcript_28498/g.44573 Transcript_28498/m.44573 type:complete len:174 (+) Transcript_28498:74-595(+)